MSLGEPEMAFVNSIYHISSSFLAGDKLPSLLEKVGSGQGYVPNFSLHNSDID